MEVFSLSAPKSRYVMFVFLVSLFMLMNIAYAEENPKADIKLISNLDGVNKNSDLILGVQFKLPKGWTTFWRTPGEVGYGAQFNWEGSSNIKSFEVFWPYPTRERIFDFYANVYENEVLFPIKIIPDNQLKPVSIKLSVDYLLCQAGACIPLQQNLSLYLPVGAAKSGKNSALIRQAMEKIPEPENTDKLFINDLTLAQLKDDSATLSFKANAQEGFNNASVFIEGPKELSFGIPKLSRIDDTSACYSIDIEKNDAKQTHLTMAEILKTPLTITFVNKDKAISISSITLPKTRSGAINSISENGITGVQDKGHSIIFTLIFAFLGGLILNLMPCVFPVLSLKILSLRTMKHKQIHGLFYTLGVMVSFMAIALTILILKYLGSKVGWGFQMQSPVFLIALIFLFTLITLNLFGFYEVPFSLTGTPGRKKSQELFYSFSTGILACVVATPCMAPFMATAIGVALYEESWKGVLIFLMLGLGFALPYLIFSMVPGAKLLLPRPGPWMDKLKQFLGFPMLLSVIWLLWVAGYQLNFDSIMMLLVSLCFLIFLFWLMRVVANKRARRISIFLSLFLIFYPLYWISQQTNPVVQYVETYPFSQEQLQQLLATKHKVFVYATAAWCITCKVNEHVAINTSEVQEFMKQHQVVLMKADWTNKNDKILRYLLHFNRAGVPLYVYYPLSQKEVVLPQILTPSIIIDALSTHNS